MVNQKSFKKKASSSVLSGRSLVSKRKKTKQSTRQKPLSRHSLSLYDQHDMRSVLTSFHAQIPHALSLGSAVVPDRHITRIVVAGMGGSALPGDLLQTLVGDAIPVYVVKDYTLPRFLDAHTLLFLVSYSGNTEETLQCFEQACATHAFVVTISSGGKLEAVAKQAQKIHLRVPSGIQPRSALGYQFFPMYEILVNAKLLAPSSAVSETTALLQQPIYQAPAKQLAKKINGTIPLIYASSAMHIVAEKWKINFNENAKTHAFYNLFPEWNHNELNGYENLLGRFSVIMLEDPHDHDRIKKRMAITTSLLTKKRIPVHRIVLQGETKLARIFYGIHLSDWVSYELAMLYKTDPTPVPIIEDLKKALEK